MFHTFETFFCGMIQVFFHEEIDKKISVNQQVQVTFTPRTGIVIIALF